MISDQERAERRAKALAAEINAKTILKPGDRLRITKCPGTKRWITFSHWDGNWIVSKSGISDFHPAAADMLNGSPIDFAVGSVTR